MNNLNLENLELAINPFVNNWAKLSREDFLSRVENVKGIRTRIIDISFSLESVGNLNKLCDLHKIVNLGDFDSKILPEYMFFAMGFPKKIFSWLNNIDASTLRKQILLWHTAYYAVNSFEKFLNKEIEPAFIGDIKELLKEYYPKKGEFNLRLAKNAKEYNDKKKLALGYYYGVFNKYTGGCPPDFLKDPYQDPVFNIRGEASEWMLLKGFRFSLLTSYFNELDWAIIVERNKEKLKDFYKSSLRSGRMTVKDIDDMISNADKDTLQRSESNSDIWEIWKDIFYNYEINKQFIYRHD